MSMPNKYAFNLNPEATPGKIIQPRLIFLVNLWGKSANIKFKWNVFELY